MRVESHRGPNRTPTRDAALHSPLSRTCACTCACACACTCVPYVGGRVERGSVRTHADRRSRGLLRSRRHSTLAPTFNAHSSRGTHNTGLQGAHGPHRPLLLHAPHDTWDEHTARAVLLRARVGIGGRERGGASVQKSDSISLPGPPRAIDASPQLRGRAGLGRGGAGAEMEPFRQKSWPVSSRREIVRKTK